MQRVLVVDDEESFLTSIAEGLSGGQAPYEVLTATDGGKAIERLVRDDFSVVLTDLKMPNVDGFALLGWLAANRPALPVIVMTAFGTPAIEESVVTGGALHFIDKPFDVAAAREAIAHILHERARTATIALVDLLRLVLHERRSGILSVSFDTESGAIAFHEGTVVGAQLGTQYGKQAAAALCARPIASFSIELREPSTPASLRRDLGGPDEPLRLKDFIVAPSSTPAAAPEIAPETTSALVSSATRIDGAIGAALIDWDKQRITSISGADIKPFAMHNAESFREQTRVLRSMGINEPIEELVVTLDDRYHILRSLRRDPSQVLFVVLDRARITLAMARVVLTALTDDAAQ